ncbi:MAG TPA: cytochrome c oxidase subunit II [Hyphomicrobiales bacterium]|nr:cytochrome c oxidase subunit II [Hyphomicrobiales bacterium]
MLPTIKKRVNKLWSGTVLMCLAALLPALGLAAEVNMPRGVTAISRDTYDLHMTIIWVCVVIGIIVYGVLVYSLIKFRKSKGAVASTFHHSTKLEIVWTLIPFLILVGVAIPSTEVLSRIYDTTESEVDILVTGYQWRWQYRYLSDEGEEVAFFSNLTTPQEQIQNEADKGEHYLLEVDEPLVVPTNTKVRLLLTSADVIHAWWVPAFAVKKDAIPGFINESWFNVEEPGIYRGQCAELCGQLHGFMPIVVNAVDRAEYDAWLAEKQEAAAAVAELASQEWTLDQLVAEGQGVYTTFCVACHQANGQGLPPAFPALTGSPIATGPIEDHIDVVLHGRPGTAMAAYGALLNPVQLAAVITFERNALGNSTGDMVTPVEILEALAAE